MPSTNPQALAFKQAGNKFFGAKQYAEAIEQYNQAIECDSNDVTFFSNRSACHAALKQWQQAADDGRQCIMVDKNFVKGYFRAGLAQQNLGNLDAALDVVKRGLGIESANADLKKMSAEIVEAQRQSKVNSAIDAAQSKIASNDIYGAYDTLTSALKLDPTNDKLNKLMGQVRPSWEREEKKRVSNLDPVEAIKEQGDNAYKASNFEKAIEAYSRAIKQGKKGSETVLKCHGNRAACYKQLSNFDGTIEDCTEVLEYKDGDVKSLMRRAQAFEACERYKFALEDVRKVLSMGMEAAGKQNYDLANGMQHRLNRVIQQLKSM